MNRRGFILGMTALLASPSIVRVSLPLRIVRSDRLLGEWNATRIVINMIPITVMATAPEGMHCLISDSSYSDCCLTFFDVDGRQAADVHVRWSLRDVARAAMDGSVMEWAHGNVVSMT